MIGWYVLIFIAVMLGLVLLAWLCPEWIHGRQSPQERWMDRVLEQPAKRTAWPGQSGREGVMQCARELGDPSIPVYSATAVFNHACGQLECETMLASRWDWGFGNTEESEAVK